MPKIEEDNGGKWDEIITEEEKESLASLIYWLQDDDKDIIMGRCYGESFEEARANWCRGVLWLISRYDPFGDWMKWRRICYCSVDDTPMAALAALAEEVEATAPALPMNVINKDAPPKSYDAEPHELESAVQKLRVQHGVDLSGACGDEGVYLTQLPWLRNVLRLISEYDPMGPWDEWKGACMWRAPEAVDRDPLPRLIARRGKPPEG